MLYPDFSDLISYQKLKFGKQQMATRKVTGIASGNHSSPFRGQGLDFDAVREYVPGDDIRNIDWRVTARTGAPHLKLFKEDKERDTILCVDMNSSMRFGTKNTFKSIQAARSASLLGWRALSQQDRVSACFFGDVPQGLRYFAPKRTRQALGLMLKTLIGAPEEQHYVPWEKVLQHLCKVALPGSLIYLISDFMDLSLDFSKNLSLSYLSKNCDVTFISINDKSDQILPPAGVIGFCGKDKEKIYFNTDSIQARELYLAQWEQNRKILDATAKRFKIPQIALSTESEIGTDLLFALKTVSPKGKKCLV